MSGPNWFGYAGRTPDRRGDHRDVLAERRHRRARRRGAQQLGWGYTQAGEQHPRGVEVGRPRRRRGAVLGAHGAPAHPRGRTLCRCVPVSHEPVQRRRRMQHGPGWAGSATNSTRSPATSPHQQRTGAGNRGYPWPVRRATASARARTTTSPDTTRSSTRVPGVQPMARGASRFDTRPRPSTDPNPYTVCPFRVAGRLASGGRLRASLARPRGSGRVGHVALAAGGPGQDQRPDRHLAAHRAHPRTDTATTRWGRS